MLIDLSHPLTPGMSRVPGLPDVMIDQVVSRSCGSALEVSLLTVPTHVGTHIDAPWHIVDSGARIDEVPLAQLHGPAWVASVERAAGEKVTVDDVVASLPGLPGPGDILLIDTGWAGHFGSDAYLDHPSLDPELAAWCVERNLAMVGTDTLTPDLPVGRRGPDFDYEIHRALLGQGVLIAENLASLRNLPGPRATAHAFPLAIRGADGAPVRFILEFENDRT